MGDKPERYLLKNNTTSDISIGDLRYRIPAGQTRDLLSKTAHLEWEHIMESRESGSIAKRIRNNTLVEVDGIVVAKPPLKTVAKPKIVNFPQRTKSYITIDVVDIAETEELSRSEDEEFWKEIEEEELFSEGDLPIIADEDDGKTET